MPKLRKCNLGKIKMEQIRFIKEFNNKKIGDIVNCSKKSAESTINAGYAEYFIGEKLSINLIDNKDFNGFHNYILEFIGEDEYILLQEIEKSCKIYNLTKGEATKIVNSEKKKIREKLREEKDVSLQSNNMLKDELLECIDELWETCDDNLFIRICKEDWRKAKYYFVLRLLKEHTYDIGGNTICGIRTFKDNKEIIIYDETNGTYVQNGDLYLAHLIEDRLKEKAENKQVNEIIESIKRKTYYNRDDLDKQPKNIKPVGNGLLNLETNELLDFTPKYIFLNKININYNKDANCDQFKKFLGEVLQTEKDIEIIQEWCGYCLLNDTKYSKALLLFGDGENGKSVLLNVIKHFLNRENVTSISLQYLESSPFAPARLFGKTANIFADLPKKALAQTSVFKMTVAGDEISGEKKGKDSFEFKPTAKMMFSCNEIPRTPDRTRGFFRRWIILKFLEHFPEGDIKRDENLFEKLSGVNELEGILNFAVDGLKRLIVQKGFTQNMKMHEVQEFWTRSSDSIATFVGDVLVNDYNSTVRKTDIYLKYEEYCTINEYPLEEINNFWKRMKDIIPFSEHQIKEGEMRIRVVQGLKIKQL